MCQKFSEKLQTWDLLTAAARSNMWLRFSNSMPVGKGYGPCSLEGKLQPSKGTVYLRTQANDIQPFCQRTTLPILI